MKRVFAFLCCCCLWITGSNSIAHAARGDLLTSFSLDGADFALDAARHRMLITDYYNNKLVAIDTRTLQQVASAVVGTHPVGVGLSPDGSLIYVANTGSLTISVMDADNFASVDSITTPYTPYSVAVGRNLYVTPGNSSDYEGIMQFNTSTNQYLGQFAGTAFIYYCGMLQISPDLNTLYFANVGLSPGTLAKYDISTGAPVQLWANGHGDLGSNGQDLTLSHAGDAIYYCVGSGNTDYGYSIAKIRTSDMTEIGYLDTGAYPTALALSPNDKVAYTINQTGYVGMFDTSTCAGIGKISTSTSMDYYGADLTVDESGTRLFVAYRNSYTNTPMLCVYDTGYAPTNVTPPTGVSVEISSPNNGSSFTINQATVDLSGTADEIDLSGALLGWGYLGSITWSNSKGGSGTGTYTNSLLTPASWSLKNVTMHGGDNIITVTATDMWGNTAEDTITVTAPSYLSASILQPTNKPVFTTIAGSVSLSGIASLIDSSGTELNWAKLSSITWYNGRGGSGTGTFTNFPASPSTWSIQNITLQGGDNPITITAVDVWGNTATDTITVTWSPGSIGAAKQQPDGTRVYVNNAVVTAPAIVSGSIFVESANRSSGIRLVTDQAMTIGNNISFTGIINRVNGEYQISSANILDNISANPLNPIFFTSSSIGNDRIETLDYIGLNTTGLLIKTAGKVTGTIMTQQLFYIDDGGSYQDGVGPVYGLRIHVPSGVTIPRTGKLVAVTGISRVEKFTLSGWGLVNGDWHPSGSVIYVPSIWVRDANDIKVY